jgi:hypothetical protein
LLSQVALEVQFENVLQDAARALGVKLRVVDCKSFNRTGMSLLFEAEGEPPATQAIAPAIRKLDGVREVIEGEGTDHAMSLLVVMDRPSICRASNEAAIVCMNCPFDAQTQPALWRFITRNPSDLRRVLSGLENQGVGTKIVGVAPLERKTELTGRQKEIVTTAVAQGFFEFPRKVSLTELSKLVGVKPSTLSEILRNAERRIMANAANVPFRED